MPAGLPGKTYVKMSCEGDRSRAIYTHPGEEGGGRLAFADTAATVFIVLHSQASLHIKIRDNRSKAYLGHVCPGPAASCSALWLT